MAPNKLLDNPDKDDPLLDPRGTQALQTKTYKQEGDFLYGHVSGTSLEEFVVTKFNRKGKA